MSKHNYFYLFKGHHGSCGFENGRVYPLNKTTYSDGSVFVRHMDVSRYSEELACTYSSEKRFLDNWTPIGDVPRKESAFRKIIKLLTAIKNEAIGSVGSAQVR